MFVPVWFTHAWSTGEGGGGLLGAYLHCTATTPFETVCKQLINGSVPFGFSLNSGFDTGNDSWFSSGAWQVGTPIQKNACRYGCSVGGREQGTQTSWLPHPVGSGSLRRKKKSLCTCQKAEDESENDQGPPSDVLSQHAHINTQCQDLHGRVEQVNSILVLTYSQLKWLPHQGPWTSSPPQKKREDT